MSSTCSERMFRITKSMRSPHRMGWKRLRYPRLDGPKVTSLAKQLADVRNRTLAAMSVNDILDIVADAAQLWADPDLSCGVRLNC